jgi:hypothetical protein
MTVLLLNLKISNEIFTQRADTAEVFDIELNKEYSSQILSLRISYY